ncbi:hypothetical protein [Dyella choica]|uniref:Uncharacterized protein n=1 Tax=Dyella choica TaxID=1927959 RepID=A0A432M5F6_9GAMM|nr:hypothetical protein [Dyella choica]RUL75276.1 hypothetical protein EKH80_11125 [Dyella choica]
MKPLKPIVVWVALSTLLVSDFAFAGWTCPDQSKPIYITGLQYDNKNYNPRIHFSSQKPGDWSNLSSSYGVQTEYGKAMLAIALAGYATGATVKVRCDGTSIDGLWLTQDGSTSPN